MKKIEKLDYNTSVYPPHIPRLQTVIEKVQELIDAHNELAKIVGLLLKRDEENCLEKAKAELIETHTVKVEKCCENGDLLTAHNCLKEEPTTPEKKCWCTAIHEGECQQQEIKLPTSSYEVTCGRCEKSIKHSCGPVRDWQSDREDYLYGKNEKQCKYCGYEYTDPKYCSVSGRTADKHKWL